MASPQWPDRFGWWIIATFLILFPLVLIGARRGADSIRNRVENWLPESFEETQRLKWFYERFGTDELLMISWEGCTLDDPRLPQYAEQLRSADRSGTEPRIWFSDVTSGAEAVRTLTTEPLEFSRDEAIERLTGWLIGPDRRQTCVVAVVSPVGEENRAGALQYAYRCAETVEGLSAEDLIMAGPTRDDVAINHASKSSLTRLSLLSFGVCIIIMAIGFRSGWATMIVFLIAMFCQQLCLAFMYFSGTQIDSVLTLAASLTYVLTISSGVHLMNYYRESLAVRSPRESVTFALRAAVVPCLLSAGTTAVGMYSLTVSQIQPVTHFGAFAAVSILAAALVLLVVAPAAMAKLSLDPPAWRNGGTRTAWFAPAWNRVAGGVARLRWLIFVAAVAVLVVGMIGAQRIATSAQLHDLFPEGAPILEDYAWLEERIGPLIPIEVVLRFPQPQQTPTDERFRLLADVQQAIQQVEGVAATSSAATYAPPIPDADEPGFRAVLRRAAVRKLLEGRLAQYVESDYLRIEDGEELWRIRVRVRAGKRLDYDDLMPRIRAAVSKALAERPSVEPIYSGSIPLIFKAQSEMLSDLGKSFGLAFVLIAAIMILLLRNPLTGLFCMLPNVLPTLLVFGAMGYLGIRVDIGSLLTASAALGIAVDDSLHFITWFRRGLAEGKTDREATRLAYEHCGVAMIQTSLICALGLLAFSLSPFVPVSRFAVLMFSLLLIALVCDLFILPAVLLCFSRTKKPPAEPAPGSPPEGRTG